jgi:hypothetical protein
VFSGIINKRIIDYCELLDLLVDEQMVLGEIDHV